jgi:tRNA threonylcarbamoyladenosine biosynthesis protein TsaB
MKVLALDTALGACSVAIAVDGRLVSSAHEELARGHAERLFDLVAACEIEAGLTAKDMDRLAVTIGPGTFTGLRVGLAAAKGMALATGKPLMGLNTLHLVALGAGGEGLTGPDKVLLTFDARRGEVYHQLFDSDLAPLSLPQIGTVEEAAALAEQTIAEQAIVSAAARLLLVGTGSQVVQPLLGSKGILSQASEQPHAAALALFCDAQEDLSAYAPDPLYLRAPDAKPPKQPLFKK